MATAKLELLLLVMMAGKPRTRFVALKKSPDPAKKHRFSRAPAPDLPFVPATPPAAPATMQSLQTWFAGSAPDKEPPAGSSVLSGWKQYSSGGGGAAGGAAPASASQLASAEEGASTSTTGALER